MYSKKGREGCVLSPFLSFKLLVTQYIVTQLAHRIQVLANTAEVHFPPRQRGGVRQCSQQLSSQLRNSSQSMRTHRTFYLAHRSTDLKNNPREHGPF